MNFRLKKKNKKTGSVGRGRNAMTKMIIGEVFQNSVQVKFGKGDSAVTLQALPDKEVRRALRAVASI